MTSAPKSDAISKQLAEIMCLFEERDYIVSRLAVVNAEMQRILGAGLAAAPANYSGLLASQATLAQRLHQTTNTINAHVAAIRNIEADFIGRIDTLERLARLKK